MPLWRLSIINKVKFFFFFFFCGGPRETGETFLYCTLIANSRSEGQIILTTVLFGIVVTLLYGGRITHSLFKISIVKVDSFCSISKQSNLAKLIRETTTIWKETPLTKGYALEALEHSLKDILDCDALFGEKVMVLGGDFHQILIVVQKSIKAQIIFTCIVKSLLFDITKVLHLCQNMCIGNTIEPTKHDDGQNSPPICNNVGKKKFNTKAYKKTFSQLESHTWDAS